MRLFLLCALMFPSVLPHKVIASSTSIQDLLMNGIGLKKFMCDLFWISPFVRLVVTSEAPA
jgi:hypothetical protein